MAKTVAFSSETNPVTQGRSGITAPLAGESTRTRSADCAATNEAKQTMINSNRGTKYLLLSKERNRFREVPVGRKLLGASRKRLMSVKHADSECKTRADGCVSEVRVARPEPRRRDFKRTILD